MNNPKLTNLDDCIFNWDMRKAITKKIDWERDNQVWLKLDYPVWCQLVIPIARPTRNAIRKQK